MSFISIFLNTFVKGSYPNWCIESMKSQWKIRPNFFKQTDKLKIYMVYRTSLVAQMVKHLPTIWETQVQSLGWEDPLEKEMATHSSTLAWKIPWTEVPGRLQYMGSQRVDMAEWLHYGLQRIQKSQGNIKKEKIEDSCCLDFKVIMN